MRVLLTLLFALFVVLVWTFYATDVWPWTGDQVNYLAAFVGIMFMAVLVLIGFRVENRPKS